jgi:flagellar basal body P-ring formation protein FlgA
VRYFAVLQRLVASFLILAVSSGNFGFAQEVSRQAFAPIMVIYPGETVRQEAIKQIVVYGSAHRESELAAIHDIVGKVAIITMLPNEPISQRMLRLPDAVKIGAMVSIRYDRPGISISVAGMALQSGAIGDRIKVRNLESSVVLVGVIRESGAVQVMD